MCINNFNIIFPSMTRLTHITGQYSYLLNNLHIHMNLIRLYDFIISRESKYLIPDESLVDAHPKQS